MHMFDPNAYKFGPKIRKSGSRSVTDVLTMSDPVRSPRLREVFEIHCEGQFGVKSCFRT